MNKDKELWQIFKTVAEFVEGFEALQDLGPAITIFGSARTPPGHPMYLKAVEVGRLVAEAGYAVVTGGGSGIMEAANKGAADIGGKSLGLNISLPHEQTNNSFQNISVDFKYFYARKVCLLKGSSGVICFPGGVGTMDEFFEVVTLVQTKKTDRVPIALIGRDYWNTMTEFLEKAMLGGDTEYISRSDLRMFTITDDITEAVELVCD